MATDTSLGFEEPITAEAAADHPRTGPNEISLLDMLIVLAERKRTILVITAAFAAIAIAFSLLVPPRYTATIVLLPPQQNTSLGSAIASQLGSLGAVAALAGGGSGGFSLRNPNDMYVAMFRSNIVEDAMINRYGLEKEYKRKFLSDARKALEKHATIESGVKDGMIHLSVEDRDPNRAAELANGYVDQFRNLSKHLAITEASQRRLFFEEQLEQAKNNLSSAEEDMKRTQQSTGILELSGQAKALIESATMLRAQIATKEVQIQALRSFATDENSQLVQAERELAGLRAQASRLGGSDIDDASAGLVAPKGQVTEAGLEYLRRYREVKYNETVFEILARQFEIAKLDEARQGSVIQVVDPATPPDRRSFPKRGMIVITATAVGLLFGSLFVLLQAGLGRIRRDPDTAAKVSQLERALWLPRVFMRGKGDGAHR